MIGFNQILKLELKEYKLESIYELNLSVPRARSYSLRGRRNRGRGRGAREARKK